MKKPPVNAKGGGSGGPAGGSGAGKRGMGSGKARGIKTHHRMHHRPVRHGVKGSGSGGPVHKKPKPAKNPKRRKWSPGWDVACCTAEALGTLLHLSDAEVLALYWLIAADPDEGASIEDTLAAAELPRTSAGLILGVTLPEPHAIAVTPDGTWWSWGEPFDPNGWPELIIEETWAVCAG